MLTWLSGNIATILIGAFVAAILTLVVVFMVKNKKKGKTSCGCSSADCCGCCRNQNKKT